MWPGGILTAFCQPRWPPRPLQEAAGALQEACCSQHPLPNLDLQGLLLPSSGLTGKIAGLIKISCKFWRFTILCSKCLFGVFGESFGSSFGHPCGLQDLSRVLQGASKSFPPRGPQETFLRGWKFLYVLNWTTHSDETSLLPRTPILPF